MVRCAPYQLRDRGGLRSSRTDRGAQVLPPAGATVPPWLPAKSARVSNLPACCALAPPACAAPCSCHHEAYTGRSAWLPLDRACLSAWIEHSRKRTGGNQHVTVKHIYQQVNVTEGGQAVVAGDKVTSRTRGRRRSGGGGMVKDER